MHILIIEDGLDLGFALQAEGISSVGSPMRHAVPDATNAKVVRDQLGNRVEFHQIKGAARLSFLRPCGLRKLTPLCADPAGCDRQVFNTSMNQQVVRFFDQQLTRP